METRTVRRPVARRRSTRRRSTRGWARPVAAAALLGALTTGWLVAGHHTAAPADVPAPAARTTDLRAHIAHADRCVDVTGPVAAVRCAIDGVDVDFQMLGSGSAGEYRRVVRVEPRPQTGPPQCAAGRPEERSWSRPDAPLDPVGRYRCAREGAFAAMWWTDADGLLAHAVARNGDLARLFAWWRSHPSG